MSAATKSTANKKAAPAKKTAAKSKSAATPRKRPVTKSTTAKKVKSSKKTKPASFRLSRETENFISSKITTQTVYWSILAAAILILGFKVLDAQLETLEVLNQLTEQI